MKPNFTIRLFSIFLLIFLQGCNPNNTSHEEMVNLLNEVRKANATPQNIYNYETRIPYFDSLLNLPNNSAEEIRRYYSVKANMLIELGREKEAIEILEKLVNPTAQYDPLFIERSLAIAYLRLGERSNCILNHAAESCILPIQGVGIHSEKEGSRKAIEIYTSLIKRNSSDFESRWLLNIAYMTLGEYPQEVPEAFLIKGLEGDTIYKVRPFAEIASSLQLDTKSMSGGSIVEDFDNDGFLDIMTSGWGANEKLGYFKNNADGTFSDHSDQVGLQGITGGLNMLQADYNNDGYQDVLVLRGAWKMEFGKEPNSLLRNNGDGTFTDVTTISGLLSFHPTQTATWNDFNNDGWVDLFIGNETWGSQQSERHPCELYINNQDGTFREIGAKANCDFLKYVKGVTSGDFDNDGWQDIFISTMDDARILLKNKGKIANEIVFEDVTKKAGLAKDRGKTFPTWFWDYNNDGWLDILTCDYAIRESLGYYLGAEKLGIRLGSEKKMLLYRNNQNGTFTNVANEVGLNQSVFAMGSNFGDINNDGYLDMYFGTGSPPFQSVIPNKMYLNIDGEKFVDVTTTARVGHLQKGHGVSFADLDNDGDQDIHIEMGGAFPGDAYQNAFFLNPGQNNNNWICINLEGTKSNRGAIGTRVKITFTENGIQRSVYRDVNSGGSFGASPLRREIGIGAAEQIDEIEIQWAGSGEIQTLTNIMPNQFIKIQEGNRQVKTLNLKKISWVLPERLCYPDGRLIN